MGELWQHRKGLDLAVARAQNCQSLVLTSGATHESLAPPLPWLVPCFALFASSPCSSPQLTVVWAHPNLVVGSSAGHLESRLRQFGCVAVLEAADNQAGDPLVAASLAMGHLLNTRHMQPEDLGFVEVHVGSQVSQVLRAQCVRTLLTAASSYSVR